MPEIKLKETDAGALIVDEVDDASGNYLLGRQLAHEYHSDATQMYLDLTNQKELKRQQLENEKQEKLEEQAKKTKPEKEFKEMMAETADRRKGEVFKELPPDVVESEAENIKAQMRGIEAPNFDPIMAGAGGFGAMTSISLNAGKALMPSLGRAITTGVVSGVGDVVPGAGMDMLDVKAPALSLPFGLAVSLLQGGTIEAAIERGIRNSAKKAGEKLSKKAMTEMVDSAKTKLTGGDFKDVAPNIIDEINSAIGRMPFKEAMGTLRQAMPTVRGERGSVELPDVPKKKKSGVSKPIGDIKKTSDEFLSNTNPDITKEYAGNIRLWGGEDLEPKFVGDIESPEDINRVIAGTHEAFAQETEIARRGVRTWEETAEAAKRYNIEDLLGRPLGQALNAEQIDNARTLLVSSSDTLRGMAHKVKMGQANDLEKMEFMRAFNTNYAIQMQLSGAAAEAGRALNIFRKVAQSDVLRVGQIKDFISATGDANISPEKIAEALSDMATPEQVSKFVKQARRATTWDMFIEAWINGLLSGPVTHAVNSLSNTLVAMYQIPERGMAAGFSKLFGDGAIEAGEVGAQTFGMIEGFKDGLKSGWHSLKTGEGADVTSKIEQQQYRAITAENVRQLPVIRKIAPETLEEGGVAAYAVDALGEVVRIPGRFLTAEDDFFKAIGYRMELRAQAYRKAAEEGLKGFEAARRIQSILENPQEMASNVHLAAIDAARYQTFTKELGEAGRGVQKAINASKVGKLIMPFIRTPANIFKFTIERSGPLALAMKSVRSDILAGGAKRDIALARMSLGAMVMATVGSYAASGDITGGGPSDHRMRAYLYNQGWQPYSIKIGDTYYSYGRLEPLGMMMGMAADFVEISGELETVEAEKLATHIVASLNKNMMSKTFLRGLSEAVSALDDPVRYGERYTQTFAGTAVPTAIAQLERQLSPEMSDVRSMMDQIKSRIPGYSDTLPARRNLWGEPIVLEGGLGPDIISPVYTRKKRESAIDKELFRIGRKTGKVPVSMPSKIQTFNSVPMKLNAVQYGEFLEMMNTVPLASTGKPLKESLNRLVTKDSVYKMLNDELKESMIDSLINEAKDTAKMQIMETNKWRFQEIIGLELMNRQQAASF